MRIPWITTDAEEPAASTTFLPVTDPDAVRALVTTPTKEPQVLFIHDQFCAISAAAYRQIAGLGGTIHLIVTGDGQHLSSIVEAHTGITHESPQAFVIQNGQVRWSASHHGIRRRAIQEAIREATPTTAES